MELYAAGFNAWNQLRFRGHEASEPDDIQNFTLVLEETLIDSVRPFLSYTYATASSSETQIAGCIPKDHQKLLSLDASTYARFAEASNGSVAIYEPSGSIYQYSSLSDLLSNEQPKIFTGLPCLVQLVAYETGFAALSSTGNVFTWGDERYASCLGREVTDESPANKPVTALEDLPTGPITKIAAGGYMLAALTSGNDLYLWGGHPGGPTVPADVTDEPSPVVINDQDIKDVGIGTSHLIALTTQGEVFVIGDNGNGQLGLSEKSVDSWTRAVGLEKGQTVVGVAAGPRCSFVIVRKNRLHS